MRLSSPLKIVNVLLVEDNPGDIRLTQEAFKDFAVPNNLHVVRDGVEVIEYLKKEGKYSGEPRPDIILLDLNLPRRDGRDVLALIKADESFKQIPVIVLTTSESEKDISRSYELHANCYITKPIDLNRFIDVVRRIENFWFDTVRLP